MPRELSKGGQRPTVKLSVWSHGRQTARKKDMKLSSGFLVKRVNNNLLNVGFCPVIPFIDKERTISSKAQSNNK
jgi:hypothetical protein